MTLWTTQGIAIYHQLQKAGIAWCNKPIWGDERAFLIAYRWMAGQMRQRIDFPPVQGIVFPMWGWYQYISSKDRKTPLSPHEIPEGIQYFFCLMSPNHCYCLGLFVPLQCSFINRLNT